MKKEIGFGEVIGAVVGAFLAILGGCYVVAHLRVTPLGLPFWR